MISPAVRVPNSTERSISSAVSASSVPSSAEREIREASSVDDRADRSSSWGSMPRRRTIALAEPLSTRIGPRMRAVNRRWNPCVARAVSMGRAIARFFGTSSAKIMVTSELTVRPTATESGSTAFSGKPDPADRVSDQPRDGGLGQEADRQVGDGDPDLSTGELRRQRTQGPEHPGRGSVTFRGRLGDLGAIDGDEGELRRDEDAGRDHQHDRDGQEQPGGQHETSPEQWEEQGEGRLSEPSMGGSGSFGLGRRVSGDSTESPAFPAPRRPGSAAAQGVSGSSWRVSQSTNAVSWGRRPAPRSRRRGTGSGCPRRLCPPTIRR